MEQTIGNLIAEHRNRLGYTQSELASRLGVTDKAVSKWERNLSCPDISLLPKLSELFGISIDELMHGKSCCEDSIEEPSRKIGLPSGAAETVRTVLTAVATAMGVATAVLSLMGSIETENASVLLGIGLACAGAAMLSRGKTDEEE